MKNSEITTLVNQLDTLFNRSKNREIGLEMSKYMKDRFPFFGIKSPVRKEIQTEWFSLMPKEISNETFQDLIKHLWEKDEREFQYVAIDLLNKRKQNDIAENDIELIERLIKNKSWWDSVDSIAANILGKFCFKFPEKCQETIFSWRYDENMWINRSCLIFQLKYGPKTDFTLLKSLITQYESNREFFIQKAIGWSLRQYSKTNPTAVIQLLNVLPLTGIARREASKYL